MSDYRTVGLSNYRSDPANSNPNSNSSAKPPDNVLKDIQKSFYKFLWNGKRDKVKREILTNSCEDGGLKMIDIKLFCQALKMTWIKKYIDPLNFSPWKILSIDSLEKWGGDKILLLGKEGLNTVASTLNLFWKDILDNFSNLQNEKVTDGNDVLSQSIWLNSHIKANNTSPCLRNWIKNDIYIINDLLDQNKQIMSYEIFQDTYHVDTTFVEFYGIISAIPRLWRHLINTCHNVLVIECIHYMFIPFFKNKQITKKNI